MSFQVNIQPVASRVPGSARNDALRVGRNFVRRRNCVGCHEIEADGGDYVSVVGDPSLAPPLLTPTGAKVKPDWLYAFLRGPITIRPWLDVRMPTFGLEDPHLNDVIGYFAAVSESVGPFRTHVLERQAAVLDPGEVLFELLQCQACHVLDEIPADRPTDNLAPDLRMAHERLQPDWVIDWLRAPIEIQPGTRMPAYWPDYPGSPFEQLDNDGERQIEAIRGLPLYLPRRSESVRGELSVVSSIDLYIRPALHPGWQRCSSLTYAQYARSSRLACRTHRQPPCTDLLNSPH